MKSVKRVKSGAQAPRVGVNRASAAASAASDTTEATRFTAGALSPARIRDIVLVVAGLLVIALDQWTKHLIVGYFVTPGYRAPVPIVGDVLSLDYVQNTGVAFSMFEGNNVQFVLIAIAIAVIGYLYWRYRESASLALKLAFGLVLGGAAGNLIDRFRQGYVVDFIHFQLPAIGFNFAVFNFADSSICVGVAAIAALLYLTAGRDETRAKDTAAVSKAPTVSAPSASANPNTSATVATAPKATPATSGATKPRLVTTGGAGKAKAGVATSARGRRKAAGGRGRA